MKIKVLAIFLAIMLVFSTSVLSDAVDIDPEEIKRCAVVSHAVSKAQGERSRHKWTYEEHVESLKERDFDEEIDRKIAEIATWKVHHEEVPLEQTSVETYRSMMAWCTAVVTQEAAGKQKL